MLTGCRVLVVDDDPVIRVLIRTILTREGSVVEEAANGARAIEALKTGKYDSVLLDLMMPQVSGFEVLEFIAAELPDYAKRCVIVFTAAADKDLRKIDPGSVFAVIRKPFELRDLIDVISRCTSK